MTDLETAPRKRRTPSGHGAAPLWTAALLTCAVGVVLSAANLAGLTRPQGTRARLRSGLAELAELRGLQRRLRPYRRAEAAFAALPDGRPPDLGALIERHLPRTRPEDRRPLTRESIPGWRLRREELTFSDVPVSNLVCFVAQAEAARPPWRLAECTLRASSKTPGHAHAVLLLEALERTDDR